MSDEIGARINKFARQTLDLHLPVLLGLMAEEGVAVEEQSSRASKLVTILRTLRVEPSLTNDGRPIAVALKEVDGEQRLLVNGQLVARVDDDALASALAEPVAHILEVSPVSVTLVLQLSDVALLRGLAGRLGRQSRGEVISSMAVGELLRWRLESFEERLYALVDGLGGWLEAAATPRQKFVAELTEMSSTWPEWRQVSEASYISIWREEVSRELERSDWADHTDELVEMVWESMVISPASALRQAAQKVRALPNGGEPEELLEVLADALETGAELGDRSLDSWPGFEDLASAWLSLIAEEDDLLGARRVNFAIPSISVFDPVGRAMGISKPENLPWELPLLCWTVRERGALCDLLQGMQKSLVADRAQIRLGRLGAAAMTKKGSPREDRQDTNWLVTVPSRWPGLTGEFGRAINAAYASVRQSYSEAFQALEAPARRQAMTFVSGTYSGYLRGTRPVWERRLRAVDGQSSQDRFRYFVTGLARALEWPIFIDPFEEGIESPPLAQMPRFTVIAVWYGDAEFAPVWIPAEAIGEALGQASIRIRNISVDSDCSDIRWLGDHEMDLGQLRQLSTDGLLRSLHEGTIRVAIRRG